MHSGPFAAGPDDKLLGVGRAGRDADVVFTKTPIVGAFRGERIKDADALGICSTDVNCGPPNQRSLISSELVVRFQIKNSDLSSMARAAVQLLSLAPLLLRLTVLLFLLIIFCCFSDVLLEFCARFVAC